MASHPSWHDSYAEAVDEVNAIERLFLGDDAIDIPRRLNPSVVQGPYFSARPSSYYVTERPLRCVHSRANPPVVRANMVYDPLDLDPYEERNVIECPEHSRLLVEGLYDLLS